MSLQQYKDFCKPKLAELLTALKLDSHFTKAQGDYLFTDDGREILDFIGGFGSTVLGHNHPEIVRTVVESLQESKPIHAQGSIRDGAAHLAQRLNELTPHGGGYYVNFSNSGAESVEAAIKHAYKVQFDKVRREYERLTRVLNDFYYKVEREGLELELPGKNKDLIDFRDDLDEYNLSQFEAFQNNPVIIAFKGSFHGKTASALKVTFNKSYREAFEGLSALRPVYIDINDSHRIPEILNEQVSTFYYPVIKGNQVELRPVSLPRVIAMVFEVVLGEGGIKPVPDKTLAHMAEFHAQWQVPYIIDEVQTGCGRIGEIYAHAQTPLRNIQPDYIVLSKALGGGVAKIGATLIRKDIYDHDFGILHTSTFAEDELSARVGLCALDILTRNDRSLLQGVINQGEYLLQKLKGLQEKFPQIIKDVRGKGLMLGVEFTPLKERSPFFRASGRQGVLSLLIASYLLEYHNIRLLAPLSTMLKGNPGKTRQSILRVQPSALVGTEEIDRFITGFDEVLQIIENNNEYCLIGHLTGSPVPKSLRENAQFFKVSWPVTEQEKHIDARTGFVVHPTTLDNLVEYYFPSFLAYDWDTKGVTDWWNRISRFLEPVHVKSTYVSANDFVLENNMVFVPYLPEMLNDLSLPYLRREVQDKVQDAVTVAKELGDDNIPVSIVGLGAYTSIVTQNAQLINDFEVPVTTGNTFTIGLTVLGIIEAARRKSVDLTQATVAVVGAAGNIGMVLAQLLAQNVGKLQLIGRPGDQSVQRLKHVRQSCWQELLKHIHNDKLSGLSASDTQLTGIGLAVFELLEQAKEDSHPLHPVAAALNQEELPTQLGRLMDDALCQLFADDIPWVELNAGLGDLTGCDVVIVSTNSHDAELIKPANLKPGAIVCCTSVPSNLSHDFDNNKKDCLAFDGGLAMLPDDSRVDFVGMPGGALAYGCLAETFLLGFDGQNHSYSKGAVTLDQVYQMMEMAQTHGFELGSLKLGEQILHE